jgi:hypothetical protein
MNRKEAFQKIKALLFSEENKFENAKLSDGTILQWEGDMAEGVALNIVDSDGNFTPAPDGTHELEDGSKITTVGGLITAIEKKAETETEVEVETEMQKMFAEFLVQFNEMKSEFASVKEKLTSYDEKFLAMETKATETESKFTQVLSIVEEIAAEPAVEIEAPKEVGFKKAKPEMTAAERIAAYKKLQTK